MDLRKSFIILLAAAFALQGCTGGDIPDVADGQETVNEDDEDGTSTGDTTETPEIPEIVDPDDEGDLVENQTVDSTVYIIYSGSDAAIENSVEGVSVTKSGAGVTVTSTIKGVEYIVSGTTSHGFFKIYSYYKFKLQLEGASISNTSGPAVNIQSGKRCFLVMTNSSSLTDGSS